MKRIEVNMFGKDDVSSRRMAGLLAAFEPRKTFSCHIITSAQDLSSCRTVPDGVILLNPLTTDFPQAWMDTPSVGVGTFPEHYHLNTTILPDHRDVGRKAGAFFANQGVAEAVFVTTAAADDTNLRKGFTTALDAQSIKTTTVDVDTTGGNKTLQELARQRCGFFLATDELALRYHSLIRNRAESYWIGRGDVPAICENLGLSCIEEDSHAVGSLAANSLLELLQGKEVVARPSAPNTQLISRESTYRFASCSDEVVLAALEFIVNHLGEPVTTDDIATAAGVSLSVLQRRFREDTGMSVLNVIQWHRVEEVKRKLFGNRHLNFEQIAHATGFTSGRHLAEVFKKWTGSTPTDFRNQLK